MREVFEKADADGGGDLDMDEFIRAFEGGWRVHLCIC